MNLFSRHPESPLDDLIKSAQQTDGRIAVTADGVLSKKQHDLIKKAEDMVSSWSLKLATVGMAIPPVGAAICMFYEPFAKQIFDTARDCPSCPEGLVVILLLTMALSGTASSEIGRAIGKRKANRMVTAERKHQQI